MSENYSCQLFERWFVDISFEYQIQSLDYFSATGRYSVPFLLPGVSFVPVLSVALSAVEVSRSIKQKRKARIPLQGRYVFSSLNPTLSIHNSPIFV